MKGSCRRGGRPIAFQSCYDLFISHQISLQSKEKTNFFGRWLGRVQPCGKGLFVSANSERKMSNNNDIIYCEDRHVMHENGEIAGVAL